MTALTDLSLAEARDALLKGQVSAVELARAQIAEIEQARILNAFIVETPDKALAMAACCPMSGKRNFVPEHRKRRRVNSRAV